MSKPLFAHLERLKPDGRTAWYPLPLEGVDPKKPVELELRHAGSSNRDYTNALMKRNARMAGVRKSRRGKIDATILDDSNEADRELFPETVIVGWRNVADDDHNEVPFSVEACREFVRRLPDWILQGLSVYASNAINFLADEEPTEEEASELAGE